MVFKKISYMVYKKCNIWCSTVKNYMVDFWRNITWTKTYQDLNKIPTNYIVQYQIIQYERSNHCKVQQLHKTWCNTNEPFCKPQIYRIAKNTKYTKFWYTSLVTYTKNHHGAPLHLPKPQPKFTFKPTVFFFCFLLFSFPQNSVDVNR